MEKHVLPDRSSLEPAELEWARKARDHPRPFSRELSSDEHEQLVDEILLEERRGERRSALQKQRLDTVSGKRLELLSERARAELELGAFRKRSTSKGNPPWLPEDRDIAGVEARVVPANRSHADRDRVRLCAKNMHEPPRVLSRHPARARRGNAAVERNSDLVCDEWSPACHPRPPLFDLLPAAKRHMAVRELDLYACPTQTLEPTTVVGMRIELTYDNAHDSGFDD